MLRSELPMFRRICASMRWPTSWPAFGSCTIAQRMRELEIDIAVDLMGLAGNSRPGA